MLAVLLPLASLPWSDVNLLIVTDVHSWVAGHPHPDHDPVLDADYGHVLSLQEHLAAAAAASGRDLFFVQNGDLNDGTGFSRKPPAALLPLLQRMPFDALTTGNHELYENENIDFLAQPGGFIDSWTGSFLTANTLNATTGEHLGASHKLLVGPNSGVRVLAFGFLYDMTNHGDHVTVTPVEEVVAQAWFLGALNATEAYDALVFLTHMHYEDPLVDVLHAAARAVVGETKPIFFVTGHSHLRAYRALDAHAAAFEAGHYLDTVGFASFALSPSSSSSSFAHLQIEANQAAMAAAAGLDDVTSLLTAAGAALQDEIKAVATNLGLDELLGCSPRTYHVEAPLGSAESLWRLHMEVTAQAALGGNASRLLVQSTGSLRYDLFAGRVTPNDVWTMCPFADQYWRVAAAVGGDDMRAVLAALAAQAPDAAAPSGGLPRYVATATPLSGETYELWTVDFNLGRVQSVYEAQTGEAATPVRMLDGSTNTQMWLSWVPGAWRCGNASCTPDPATICTAEWAPVCGADGITYSNACRAAAACQLTPTDGPCGGEGPGDQKLELLLLLLLVPAVLLVPLLLCLHRRRRLPCLGNALRHVRFTDNTLATRPRRAKTAEAGVTMPASTVEGRRDEGAAPAAAAAEATTQESAASV